VVVCSEELAEAAGTPPQLQEKIFEKLFSEAEVAKLNPEEMKTYQESLKVFRDNQNAMGYMLQKGKEEGMKQGMKEGLKEGQLEARVEMAKWLKQMILPIEQIMEGTKLIREEIEKL
jgi:predicted transposase/invertase (TIGR01784 family)